jgi:phosphoenolpyruvate synthase/pyruvate phosphate dikinase
MTALLWYIDRIFEAAPSSRAQQAGARVLGGIAAAPGRHTGPVRVVMDESEFGKLRPGDVLVCPITSPVWSVLFPSIGALVTDTGGLLSHPAIIAREYRVPAVVATGNATALLHDGQLVTVDGGAGRIEVRR